MANATKRVTTKHTSNPKIVNSLIYANIRGLNQKKSGYIRELLENSENCKIAMFSETHLNADILDPEIAIKGFNIIRADRKNRTHGGTCIFLEETLPYKVLLTWSNSVCEICAIESLETILVCVYRPPDCKIQECRELKVTLENLLRDNDSKDIVVAGDFNFPNVIWEMTDPPSVYCKNSSLNGQSKLILEMLEDNFMFQYINQSTRKNNILVLIFSNNENIIQELNVRETKLSDHAIIEISSSGLLISSKLRTIKTYEKFNRLNF